MRRVEGVEHEARGHVVVVDVDVAGELGGAEVLELEVGDVRGGVEIGRGVRGDDLHLRRPTEVPDVVARHHAALRVPDQVDLRGARRASDRVDEVRHLPGGGGYVTGAQQSAGVGAVVDGEDAVPGFGEQRGQGRPVVVAVLHGAVHEDHGTRMRGVGAAGEVVGTGGHGRGVGQGVHECRRSLGRHQSRAVASKWSRTRATWGFPDEPGRWTRKPVLMGGSSGSCSRTSAPEASSAEHR